VQYRTFLQMSSWLAPGTHACTHHAGTPDLTEEVHEGTSQLYFAIVDERVDVVIGRDAL
jgi:hypothetical protein